MFSKIGLFYRGKTLGASKVWVYFLTFFSLILFLAYDPFGLLTINTQVQIKATGAKNPQAKSSEVWILNTSKDLNYDLPIGWEVKDKKVVSYKDQPTTIKMDANLTRNTTIQFEKHPYSGIVEISVLGKIKKIDLYSTDASSVTIRPFEVLTYLSFPWVNIIKMCGFCVVFGGLFFVVYKYLFQLFGGILLDKDNEVVVKNTNYLGRLDHLRFVAASLVILYHFFREYFNIEFQTANPFVALISQGHTGVGLFMILSGFIFGVIGYQKKLSYSGFIYNRVIRIYPLYLFVVFIAYSSHRSDFSSSEILFFFFPFLNTKLVSLPLFGQSWSIGVEFLFYLIFPFLNLFVSRYGIKYIFGFLFMSVFIKEFYFISTGFVRDIAYWTILGRIDQFLVGMLFAYFFKSKPKLLSNPIHLVISTIIVIGVIQAFNKSGGYFLAPNAHFWVIWPLVEGLIWAYFSLSYLNCSLQIPIWLNSLLSKFGSISFSLYLMHTLIIPLVRVKIGILPFLNSEIGNVILTGILVVIPCVCILSLFTYYLIEKPFFSFKKKYTIDESTSNKMMVSYSKSIQSK